MGDVKLTQRSLRAMRTRWETDLERIEARFPDVDLGTHDNSVSETIRNLATAIAHIDGIITDNTIFPRRAALSKAEPSHTDTEGER